MPIFKLTSQQLYRPADIEAFSPDCKSTKSLTPLDEIIGQQRAQQAVEFAMSIKDKGYNIYAIGRNGLGKRTMMLRYLHQEFCPDSPLFDWCYVANFSNTRTPKVLPLPAGMGLTFKKEVEALIKSLVSALPLAFDNELYFSRSDKLKEELTSKQESALLSLNKHAEKYHINLSLTSEGDYQLVALNGDKPHTEESFLALPEEKQREFEQIIAKLEKKLRAIVRNLTEWEEEFTNQLQALNEEVALEVIRHFMTSLQDKYDVIPDVSTYLLEMQKDMLEHIDIFIEESEEQLALAYAALDKKMPRRYQVNVLVGQENGQYPIVVEDNPNYHAIFGYIENATYKGTVFSDFSLIRSGSLHRANGGVLLMDAIKVLERPYVWDGLKRALRSRKLNLSSLEREVTLSGSISLDPEPIPLDVKIILFGDAQTYQLLQHYDPEFSELFRITADFEDHMPRNSVTEHQYSRFIASILHDNNMLHCDRSALARVIEYSARQAESQNLLSLHSAQIANLLRESHYCGKQANSTILRRHHIEQALQQQAQRVNRLQTTLLNAFEIDQILLTTQGCTVGQINALSVIATNDHQFGLPSRITATTTVGEGKVFDIERDVKFSGQSHSKGVRILSAYLASLLGQENSIPVTTHLTFEQSYCVVDGDSASLAECCAILSVFADVPIDQHWAMTGSMNQLGETQAIGGVNDKIEGFFDVCMLKGRHIKQGVIIPRANVQNLMLREDVVQAVVAGQFHIIAVDHIMDAVCMVLHFPDDLPLENRTDWLVQRIQKAFFLLRKMNSLPQDKIK